MTLPAVLFYADLSTPFAPPDLQRRPLGGSETALVHVTGGLARLGHRVIVAAHPGAHTGVHDGVDYVNVESSAWQDGDVDMTVVFRQLPHVRRRLPGRTRLVWVHDHIGIYPELPRGIGRALLGGAWRFGYRVFGRYARTVVAVSDWLARCFVEFARWPTESVTAIPNAVDPALFDGAHTAGPPVSGRTSGRLRVAYTSVPERGLELLVGRIMPAIWRAIPGVELDVYSYRPLEPYRGAAHGPGRVNFRGGLRKSDLARELAAADLWLYPTDFPETSCIAAMEAQAAGVPVVSSRRYALRETVVDGQTGVLIDGPVGSADYVDRFAKAAVALLSDPARRARMAAQARRHILERYTWDRVSAQWSELLIRLGSDASSSS